MERSMTRLGRPVLGRSAHPGPGRDRLAAGSYLYGPPGVAHPIVADAEAGCTLPQLHGPYRPHAGEPVDG